MIFTGGLCEKVLDGSKTVTRRPVKYNHTLNDVWPCQYAVGKTYAVQPGRGKHSQGRIRILSVDRVPTFPITTNEARFEGFDDPVQFESKWIELYGANGPGACWRIEFELA